MKPAHRALLLIILLTLAVYYLMVFAGFNSVDDEKMVGRYALDGHFDLWQHFFPLAKRYYYRPLTTLTYVLDYRLWGALPSVMHLSNILIHLTTACLVFAITRQVMQTTAPELDSVRLPTLAALLFSLHPLATEAVCWVSGRTDLLAGLFLLLALTFLLRYLQGSRGYWLIAVAVALLGAALSKEVAVFALPGFLWLILIWPDSTATTLRERFRTRCLVLSVPLCGVATYFAMRYLALPRDSGSRTALKGVSAAGGDIFDSLRIACKVYGFYFKKLLFPWPLSFAITEISAWYVFVGIVLAGLLLLFIWRRSVAGALCLLAFCTLSPALLVPLGKMAWTPIAERYLYIPLALSVGPFVLCLCSFWQRRWPKTSPHLLLVGILLLLVAGTLQRVWVWQDNVRLYQDTLEKNPGFLPAKNELATALRQHGRSQEADALLEELVRQSPDSDYRLGVVNLALSLAQKGQGAEGRQLLLSRLDPQHKSYPLLLQKLVKVNDLRMMAGEVGIDKRVLERENLTWLLTLQAVQPSPFTLYRIAILQRQLGNADAARTALREVVRLAPSDAYYLVAARTMLERLEGRQP